MRRTLYTERSIIPIQRHRELLILAYCCARLEKGIDITLYYIVMQLFAGRVPHTTFKLTCVILPRVARARVREHALLIN